MKAHLLATLVTLVSASSAPAFTYDFNFIAGSTWSEWNTGQVYYGNGIIGMHDAILPVIGPSADYFIQRVAWKDPLDRNVLEVNLGSLRGQAITSATLSMKPSNGIVSTGFEWFSPDSPVTAVVQIESIPLSGSISGSDFTGPILGQTTGIVGMQLHSTDITGLVQSRFNSGEDWLGLRFYVIGPSNLTKNDPFFVGYFTEDGPPAIVRLDITLAPVPETASTGLLLGLGLLGLAMTRRHQRAFGKG